MTSFALLFPGQGSQSVGMLAGLADARPEISQTFAEASAALGRDLWALVCEGPAEELNRTELTQPVMLTSGVAIWRVWLALGGPQPSVLAGHSLGEYSALVAAGAIDFADAVRVVARRGELMQAAVPAGEGAMAAILGLDDELVEAICREAEEGEVVAAANYNSPGQLVIAGHATAVERAIHRCRDAGAKRALVLPVSVPAHSELMRAAGDGLAATLASIELRPPSIPVLHNVDLEPRFEPEQIRAALVAQLWSPVRWTETVRRLAGQGLTRMAECGPGRVLAGLGRRIERGVSWAALDQLDSIETTLSEWKD